MSSTTLSRTLLETLANNPLEPLLRELDVRYENGLVEWAELNTNSERIPIPQSSEYKAAFIDAEAENTAIALVTDAADLMDEQFVWVEPLAGDTCSVCDDNESYSRSHGTPARQAHTDRGEANCAHANAAREAVHLGADSCCDECGCWEVAVDDLSGTAPDNSLATPIRCAAQDCANCGTRLN